MDYSNCILHGCFIKSNLLGDSQSKFHTHYSEVSTHYLIMYADDNELGTGLYPKCWRQCRLWTGVRYHRATSQLHHNSIFRQNVLRKCNPRRRVGHQYRINSTSVEAGLLRCNPDIHRFFHKHNDDVEQICSWPCGQQGDFVDSTNINSNHTLNCYQQVWRYVANNSSILLRCAVQSVHILAVTWIYIHSFVYVAPARIRNQSVDMHIRLR